MANFPEKPVSLAMIWECPGGDDPERHVAAKLVALIEREFDTHDLYVWGHKPGSSEYERVNPLTHQIDWIGLADPRGYWTGQNDPLSYRPTAVRPIAWDQSPRGKYEQDRRLNLVISRTDWERLYCNVMATCGPGPASEPQPVAPSTPTDGRGAIGRLAEWIFARHERRLPYKSLRAEALLDAELGTFRGRDFLDAYQCVYETAAKRPPATGWPLRSPYKERLEDGKSPR